MAAVEMQVRAAEGCGCDFEDCVGGVLNGGDGSVFDDDFVGFFEDHGAHGFGWHF